MVLAKWKDFKDPVSNPTNPRVVFFYLPALEKAKQRSIRCSVLIAFGPNVPHNLFCNWLGDWLEGHDITATMHKRVCEGVFVVVCDKEGACDIPAPALRDYPNMRPAVFPVSVDLFTKADDLMLKVISLPNLPFQSQCYLPAIANKLGLFVGHTGADDSPKAPRIPENTFLGHFLYNQQQSCTPAPVKILILAQNEKRIPSYLQLQISQDEWYRQTLVQEVLNFPYSPIFPPERRQPRFFTSLENKRSRLYTVLNTRSKRLGIPSMNTRKMVQGSRGLFPSGRQHSS
ncbi:hypothetical protein M758_5G059800 [Ceratodon purpureus]|uniref:Uncharacterized protein n=1 Tax=Ceratodon purpureus TaxID=3225 RepID=A0A8T0HZX6_CERPU|nr:hypothetical protein KC19_5G064700 [Ceratodon purpureus]KAG0615695.1 hypothetical protein M758_5G059800 [Ceratodon purpureus]